MFETRLRTPGPTITTRPRDGLTAGDVRDLLAQGGIVDPEQLAAVDRLEGWSIGCDPDLVVMIDWQVVAPPADPPAPPGGFGTDGAALSPVRLPGLDPCRLAPTHRDPDLAVDVVKAHVGVISRHHAQMLEATMRVVSAYEDLGFPLDEAMEGAASELRAALSLTRRAAEHQLELAYQVTERLPRLFHEMIEGRLDLARVRVIVDGLAHLDTGVARNVLTGILEHAPTLTTGQLRARLRRECIDIEPEDAERRYQTAVDDRMVSASQSEDGSGTIIATGLAAERVGAVMDHIDRIAKSLRTGGEIRSIDQLRADVFLDLLAGGKSVKVGTVDIRIDIDTLLELDKRAVELEGFGPIIADLGRELASIHGSQWRTTITGRDGAIIHTSTTKRRPDRATRRHVEARDVTCIFPGCRRPAAACDLDHRVQVVDGGDTHPEQLVALCRHDHVLRHRLGWRHTSNPDGSHTWVSPLGNRYTRPPP
ncbi:MAG: HNH endonuclease [Acidimicrobiia bacterium]|nr:HNH endonuclease [Acidimicrobiia bacterium]MDH4306713.1 HNH endonuclease [Acidimicrobiia bacterium]MDH5292684.1 HNH endonuclease [Acidimicrobiia bacterium]